MKKFIPLALLVTCSVTHAYRDTETGTFLTRDPIGYQDGPNLYCYVHCNPITNFDPLGLFIETTQSDEMEEYFDENGIDGYTYDEDRGGYTFGDDAKYNGESLTSEILYGLLKSDRVFTFSASENAKEQKATATENLKTHVAAREGIVNYASQNNFTFGVGDEVKYNDKLWTVKDGQFVPIPGKETEAFADLHNNSKNYVLDCQWGTEATMQGGSFQGSGNTQIMGQYTADKKDWIPGDAGYIRNLGYQWSGTPDGTRGENIIYAGQNKGAWGHFSNENSYQSVGSWQKEVTSWNGASQMQPIRSYPAAGIDK